jgi:ABC-type transport system substrate-binding protein
VSASNEADFEAVFRTNPDIQYHSSPAFVTTFSLAFNNDLPMWQDVRIRRAVALAVDRPALATVIYGNFGRPDVATIDWRFFWDSAPTLTSGQLGPWWRTSVAESKQLLQAVGQESLSFEMIYYNYTPDGNQRPDEVLVDQLRAAGIQMKATSVEYSEFNSQWTTRTGTAQAFDGWVSYNPTAQQYVYGIHHSASGNNRYRIKDAEIDAWAEQHLVELDPNKRRDLAQKVWTKVYDQVYRVEKPAGQGVVMMQPWLRGYRSRGDGSGQFYLDMQNRVRNLWIDK